MAKNDQRLAAIEESIRGLQITVGLLVKLAAQQQKPAGDVDVQALMINGARPPRSRPAPPRMPPTALDVQTLRINAKRKEQLK